MNSYRLATLPVSDARGEKPTTIEIEYPTEQGYLEGDGLLSVTSGEDPNTSPINIAPLVGFTSTASIPIFNAPALEDEPDSRFVPR